MLAKFEAHPMIRNEENVELFDKELVLLNYFWQNVDAILHDVSVAEIIV